MCDSSPPRQSALEAITNDVWSVAAPHTYLGIHFGTRMNVVRLRNGAVLLHSPIAIDDELADRIAKIGPVRHIVCPNSWHHVYAAPASQRYADAIVYAPKALTRKRHDLRIDAFLSDAPPAAWCGDLLPFPVRGTLLHETVLFHRPSGTLLTADLVENFQHEPHWLTRNYLRLGGIYRQPGWHRLLRFFYWKRSIARRDVQRVLELPIERALIAHGTPLLTNAHASLRSGLAWLLRDEGLSQHT